MDRRLFIPPISSLQFLKIFSLHAFLFMIIAYVVRIGEIYAKLLLTIAFPVLAISFAVLLPYFVIKKAYSKILWMFGIYAVIVVASFFGLHLEKADIEIDKGRGDLIVTALHEYKDEKGIFPEQLSELIPEHFSNIPKTTRGKQFYYYRWTSKDDTTFTLRFAGDLFGICYAESGRGQWEACDDPW